MRLVVTGATGFLGMPLVKRLLSDGHEVLATGRNPSKLRQLSDIGAFTLQADLAVPEVWPLPFSNIDVVVHCAGLSTIWGDRKDFIKVNYEGTKNIFKWAEDKYAKKFIFISTPSVYIDKKDLWNICENDELPKEPINHYAYSKRLAENFLLHHKSKVNRIIILRPQGIFGPGDTAIYPRLKKFMDKQILPTVRGADCYLDMTYVDNVVEAIVLGVNEKGAGHDIYNVSNDEPISTLEYLRNLFEALNAPFQIKKIPKSLLWILSCLLENLYLVLKIKREPILNKYVACVLTYSRTLSIKKIQRDFGYKPVVSMSEGTKLYLQWLEKQNVE